MTLKSLVTASSELAAQFKESDKDLKTARGEVTLLEEQTVRADAKRAGYESLLTEV